jgi:branched-chain amino acid transport system permease protein
MNAIRQRLTWLVSNPYAQACLVLGLLVGANYMQGGTVQILSFALVSILFSQSIYILTGMTGQISLGHAAFFGVGAYGTAILTKTLGLSLLVSVPLAGLLASLVAFILSYPAGRVKEVYLAMMTLGFGQIFLELAREWTSLTGGVMGLSGVPSASLGTLLILGAKLTTADYFRGLLLITVGAVFFVRNFSQSRMGRSLFMVHNSELAAGSVGIDRGRTKQLAYALSGLFAGFAGAFYAHLVGYLGPDSFTITRSIEVLVIAIVGGLWSIGGQIISAIFFTLLPEQLQVFTQYQFIVYGLILTFTLILLRQGIGGLLFASPRFIRPHLRRQAKQQAISAEFLRSNANPTQISVKDITMKFGGLVAVDNVSIDIPAHRITALVGPNGSGKSTLVNLISGVFPPTSGRVLLNAADVTGQSDVAMAKLGIIRTFQDPRLVPHFTVRENILLGAHAKLSYGWFEAGLGLPRANRQERLALQQCDSIIELLEIAEVADQPVESLPYGYRRMTEIGRALMAGPKAILLDEPAAGLSDVEMVRLAEVLKNLKSFGITILLIEHHMDFLTDLVDEVVVLDSGSILFRGSMREMRQDAGVIAAYLGVEGVEHA